MSSLESTGFPPGNHPVDGHEVPAADPFAAPALSPLQPFDEVQPLQPLASPPEVESYPLQQPDTVEFQPPAQQVEPLQPLAPPPALEPLQPTMPPPLPLLHGAEPALVEPSPAGAPPVPTSEEVANLGVPLGTLIFRAGLLTEEQLEDALQEGVRSGKRLGEVLLEGGLIDERDLGRLLADQKGLRFVELAQLTLDPAATVLLTPEKAHMFAALPVGFEDGVPVVAVADPSNELVTENLRRALDSDPRLVVASRSDLHSTIDHVHGATVEEEPAVEEPVVAEPVAEEPVFEAPVVEAAAVEAPVVEEPAPVVAEPVFSALAPEPQPEPAVEHVPAPEPVAEVQPEPAPAYEAPAPPEVPPLVAPVEVAVEPAAVAVPAPEPVAEPTPEPELRPVEVERVAPLVPEAPEAVAEPAPVLPEPEPVPLTPEPQPMVVEPAPEPVYDQVEQAPEAQPTMAAEHGLPSAVSYDVSLRLADGERVAIGSFGDPQKAREYAREVVRHLSEDSEEWPFFSGRFMRPDTIVSVDIVPVGEPDRWLGSSVRSNWASRLHRQ